jgi:hypothetical protein
MTNNIKNKISKITLIIMFFSLILNFLLLTSTPLFESFFIGHLAKSTIPANYSEKYYNSNYYITIYKYYHVKGRTINNSSFDFIINNTGSNIEFYEPIFKSLYNKKGIRQEKDKRYVRLEIPEIRPNEEFDIRIYTKTKPDISAKEVMSNGKVVDINFKETIRIPIYFLIAIIFAFFIFSAILCYRTNKIIQDEKERVIKERNDLQNIIMEGKRLTSGGTKK